MPNPVDTLNSQFFDLDFIITPTLTSRPVWFGATSSVNSIVFSPVYRLINLMLPQFNATAHSVFDNFPTLYFRSIFFSVVSSLCPVSHQNILCYFNFITSSINFLHLQFCFSSMRFTPIVIFDFLNQFCNTQSVQVPSVDLLQLPGLIIKQLLNCRVP